MSCYVLYRTNYIEPNSFHWKKAESIETDMKIILSPK